ncbi:MAG: HNH endonuclease [Thermoplasmata archaeon]|nr:HNH endonuclease [Thermoplasmata archaeon]
MSDDLKCAICERTFFTTEGRFLVGKSVVHHLIPKQKFRGKHDEAGTITICARCHGQLHKLYDNITLKKRFININDIKSDPEMQKFVRWIRKEK